jgi:gamma-glutamylcyclotransferase (GGCT)/AIG2-like uncharacterized protein YtfP
MRELLEFSNLREILNISEKEFANLHNLKKLDLNLREEKEFPLEICQLTNLEELEVWGKLTKLPKEFTNLQNLKKLYIGFDLKEFPLEICELTNLKKLQIWGEVTKLPKEISNLQNLKKLEISGNLEEVTISDFEKLEELITRANYIKLDNLPNLKYLKITVEKDFEISKNSSYNLETLYLEGSEKEELDLSDFPNLKILEFRQINFQSFKLSEKTDLQSLKISHTDSIKTLPKIENLKELYIYDTKFSYDFHIPENLKKLGFCMIDTFPEWIKKLSDLESLRFDTAGFEEIPDWIENLKKLRVLDFTWSSLTNVPETVTNLKNLEQLHLLMNHIKSYPQNLEKLKNLKELVIDTEKISFDEYNRIRRALPNTEISEKDIEIFVYGTLKKDFPNHHLLENMEYLGNAVTEEKYPMISENGQYPYLIDKEGYGKKIEGEVYRINLDILKDMDLIEGYPKHYSRREIKVVVYPACELCWRCTITYFANSEIDYSKYELLSEFTEEM